MRIAILKKDGSRVDVVQIEACVSLSYAQIRSKSKDFEWFVYDETGADKIFDVHRGHAVIADDILAPLEAEQYFKTLKNPQICGTSKYKPAILNFIKTFGGGATKTFIQAGTGFKETTLRSELENLIAKGTLSKTQISLVPNTSRGRDLNLYYLLEKADNYYFFQKQIIYSYAIRELLQKGYTLNMIDKQGVAIFYNQNEDSLTKYKDKSIFLFTDFDVPVGGETPIVWGESTLRDYGNQYYYEFESTKFDAPHFFYASTDILRINEIKKDLPQFEIIDLSLLKEAQSYRHSSELNSKTITRDNRNRID